MNYFPNQAITANGDHHVELGSGEYGMTFTGDFGGGTLSVRYYDGVNTPKEYDNGNFTAAGGYIYMVTTEKVILNLSGATSPSIQVRIKRVDR